MAAGSEGGAQTSLWCSPTQPGQVEHIILAPSSLPTTRGSHSPNRATLSHRPIPARLPQGQGMPSVEHSSGYPPTASRPPPPEGKLNPVTVSTHTSLSCLPFPLTRCHLTRVLLFYARENWGSWVPRPGNFRNSKSKRMEDQSDLRPFTHTQFRESVYALHI